MAILAAANSYINKHEQKRREFIKCKKKDTKNIKKNHVSFPET